MGIRKIPIEEFEFHPFTLFAKEWALVTAQKGETVNTMTIGYGKLGTLWNRPVVTVYSRPQRYTTEFLNESEYFSVTVFPEEYRKQLLYLGTVSGRDEDKISKSGLTVEYKDGIPYFKEAKLIIFAKKIYQEDIQEDKIVDKNIVESRYPEKDFHRIYVGEVTAVYEEESYAGEENENGDI